MKKMLAACLTVTVLLTGCGQTGETEGYKRIVDDFAVIALEQDKDSADYSRALAAVGAYLETPGEEQLKDTREEISIILKQMEEDSQKSSKYVMDESFSELLTEYGIDPEEYQINADMRNSNLGGYIESLKTLELYLEYEEYGEDNVTKDALVFTYEYNMEDQECLRGYGYYSINYWFAQWGVEETAYVKEQVVDRLESFVTEESIWENSREAVERKMTLYLDRMEVNMDRLLEFIGSSQEELYRMEKERK